MTEQWDAGVWCGWARRTGDKLWVLTHTGTHSDCARANSNHAVINKWKDSDTLVCRPNDDPNRRKRPR
jgi:hypothetical protein